MVDATRTVDMADVMTKISQIRTLSARASTQAEAEVASTKMARLLLQYNLTLGDIDRHVRQTNRKVVDDIMTTTSASWNQELLSAIAKAHLCKTIYVGKGMVSVVGHEHNLIVVRETWEWLKVVAETSMKLARNVAKQLGDRRAAHAATKWGNDFKMGFADAINTAYETMRAEVKAETATDVWAIVPVLEGEVAVEFTRLYPRVHNRTTYYRESDAYGMGQAAGATVNLGGQLGQSRANKQIGG